MITAHRERLLGIVHESDSLIPELLERGRAPNGSFPPIESLGYVELDRGEDDLRPFVSQAVSLLLEVVTDEERPHAQLTSVEPITIETLMERLNWCVASTPVAAKLFPEWSNQQDCERLTSVCILVEKTLREYYLRLLEVADTEEPVLEEMAMPPTNRLPVTLTFFKPFLTIGDHEYEVSKANAVEIRDWLLDAVYALGTKLPDQQLQHMIAALYFSDGLCLVSKAQWIPDG